MKSIEASQLQEKLLLAATETLSVEQNGKLLGYFYPAPQDEGEIDAVWERLDRALERAVTESGMDREALIDALDTSKPFPFEDEPENTAKATLSETNYL